MMLALMHQVVQNLVHRMNAVKQLAHSVLQRQESSVRFSITLTETDNRGLEEMAELSGISKSAFCSELINAALSDLQTALEEPSSEVEMETITAKQYKGAFIAIEHKLTKGHIAMLTAHANVADYTTTATALAKAAGYINYGGANLQYARIGKMLADYLQCDLPKSNNSPLPTAMLVKWHFNKSQKTWYCTLRPEVIAALKATNIVR
jgi:hypothetical protein